MNKLKGQSLIEITVALGIVVVLLSITTIAITQALHNAKESTYRNQADALARQGIEIVRQMRDSEDWATFSNLSGTYCLASSCTLIVDTDVNCWHPSIPNCGRNADIFNREITITPNSSECSIASPFPVAASKVQVKVAWGDSKCTSIDEFCQKTILDTCMANIRSN